MIMETPCAVRKILKMETTKNDVAVKVTVMMLIEFRKKRQEQTRVERDARAARNASAAGRNTRRNKICEVDAVKDW